MNKEILKLYVTKALVSRAVVKDFMVLKGVYPGPAVSRLTGVAETDFHFRNLTKAEKVDLKDLKGTDDLPDHFMKGEKQWKKQKTQR